MKLLYLILIAAFLTAPCMAMSDTQAAYLKGFSDGWHILYLRFADHAAFDEEVQAFNDDLNKSLNESEAAANWLAPYESAIPADYKMPDWMTENLWEQ